MLDELIRTRADIIRHAVLREAVLHDLRRAHRKRTQHAELRHHSTARLLQLDDERIVVRHLEVIEHLQERPLVTLLETVQCIEVREDCLRIADLAVREFNALADLERIRQTIGADLPACRKRGCIGAVRIDGDERIVEQLLCVHLTREQMRVEVARIVEVDIDDLVLRTLRRVRSSAAADNQRCAERTRRRQNLPSTFFINPP